MLNQDVAIKSVPFFWTMQFGKSLRYTGTIYFRLPSSIHFSKRTRAAPDSLAYTFRPPIACTKWDTIGCPEGPHKSMTFQHGCPPHCGPPGGMYFLNTSTRAAPDSPVYTFRPPPEELHKLMMFQHGCPHHWKPPGRMYFYNTSIRLEAWVISGDEWPYL